MIEKFRRRSAFVVAAVLGLFLGAGPLAAQSPDHILDLDIVPGVLTAQVTTQLTTLAGGAPIESFSYGVCHDFNVVQPLTTISTADLQVANLGSPPDFEIINLQAGSPASSGGVTHGVVLCLLLCATLPTGATTDLLQIEYDIVGPGPGSPLQYCDDAEIDGAPATEISVVSNGILLTPTLGTGVSVPEFIRGDTDANGVLQIGDGINLLAHLFQGQAAPVCRDAADSNDDGVLDIADAAYFLVFLFCCGAPPPPPWPNCGLDPSADSLDCLSFPPC